MSWQCRSSQHRRTDSCDTIRRQEATGLTKSRAKMRLGGKRREEPAEHDAWGALWFATEGS